MKNSIEQSICHPPQETFVRDTSIFRVQLFDGSTISGVSANTWVEYTHFLSQLSTSDRFIVSPELITFTGKPLDQVNQSKSEINSRINYLLEFSLSCPEKLFLLGTPTFPSTDKPKNSVLFIQNGQVIDQSHKRAGATPEEYLNFQFNAREKPVIIPGTRTAVLICADLPTATIYLHGSDDDSRRYVLETYGKTNLLDIDFIPRFIPQEATSLVVLCCWAIGSRVAHQDMDSHYQIQLRNNAWAIMRETAVREVVAVDRILDSTNLSAKPYNAYLRIV